MPRPVVGNYTVTDNVNTVTHTTSLPTHSQGDLLICIAVLSRQNTILTINQGYTPLFNVVGMSAGRALTFRAFAKVAGASEVAPTVTSGAAGWTGMIIIAVSGATSVIGDITNATGIVLQPPDYHPTLPACTVNYADSIAIRVCMASDDNQAATTPSPPAGHTTVVGREDGAGRLAYGVCWANADPSSIATADWMNFWTSFASDEVEGVFTIVVPPASQIIAPSGIDGEENFGSSKTIFRMYPSSVLSAEGFGATKATFKIDPTGIGSLEAHGNGKLNSRLYVGAILSEEGFGTPLFKVFLLPTGMSSEEAVGSLELHLRLLLSGIVSEEALGSLFLFTTAPIYFEVVPRERLTNVLSRHRILKVGARSRVLEITSRERFLKILARVREYDVKIRGRIFKGSGEG